MTTLIESFWSFLSGRIKREKKERERESIMLGGCVFIIPIYIF